MLCGRGDEWGRSGRGAHAAAERRLTTTQRERERERDGGCRQTEQKVRRQDGSSNSQLESAPATDAPDILALKGNGAARGLEGSKQREEEKEEKRKNEGPRDARDVSLIQIDLLGGEPRRELRTKVRPTTRSKDEASASPCACCVVTVFLDSCMTGVPLLLSSVFFTNFALLNSEYEYSRGVLGCARTFFIGGTLMLNNYMILVSALKYIVKVMRKVSYSQFPYLSI